MIEFTTPGPSDDSQCRDVALALKEQRAFEARLLDAIENLAGAFVLWDAEDRLEVFNSRAKALYGLSDDIMVVGRTFEEVIRKAVETQAIKIPVEEQEEWIAERVRHHSNVSEVMTRRYPDGRWVRITEHKTHDGGTVGIGVDITELKKREMELEDAREEAEQANRAKTRFLAAASHDLRQPLHAMGLFLASLSKSAQDERSQDLVRNLQTSLDSMNTLFSALLDISRLDADVLKPNLTNLPISQILETMTNRFAVLAREKGLDFKIVPCHHTVRSDPAMLERIVSNFIANAVRYTERGRILVGCRRRGLSLRLEVLDTGKGIPKDQLRDVFKEFHQVDNPERDRSQGLGLGQAIAERMSALLKHKITVSSQPGVGSCFAVTLPLSTKKPTEKPAAPLPSPSLTALSGRVIAVVEDDKEVLSAMAVLLKDLGCEMVGGESAAHVVAALSARNLRPEVIIADYRLRAGATGSPAIAEVRQALNASAPGVIITGDTAPERLREARASGFTLLHKPVHPANLTAVIRHLLK